MNIKNISAALAIALVSGSTFAADTIDFWTPFTGPDGANMQQIVDSYNDTHDGYDIKMQVIPGDVYYEKIRTASRGGNGPLISVVHADQIPTLVVGDLLKDMGPLAKQEGLSQDQFIKAAWDTGMYEGVRYSIPLDVHPLVMYYNKDIVNKYHLSIPTTYAELIANSKKITDKNIYGFALPTIWPTNLVFRTAMLQNGADVISADGKKSNVDSAVGMKAATMINDLWAKEKIAPAKLQRDGHIVLFKQGKAAYTIDGIWMSQGFNDAKVNYGVAPIGTLFGDTPAVWANSHQLVMMKNTKTNDEKNKAAVQFLKYLTDNGAKWAKANMIPAKLDVINSDEFKALPVPYAASKQMDYIKLAPQMSTWIDVWGSVESHLSNGLLGNIPLDKALKYAAQEGTQKAQETLESLE